ncbi:MAG: hypothetical protein IPG43_14040 [Proteobacteria bacterium]|nr:hypothetical protein [Pseudomonadota bacterium]
MRAPPATAAASSAPWSIGGVKLFGDDGFNFRDVLDLINPIQHIPIIGNLYRNLTGDVAAPAIRIAGGALFGGPLGAAFAAANVALKQIVHPDLDATPLAEPGTALAAKAPPGAADEAKAGDAKTPGVSPADDSTTGKALSPVELVQLKNAYSMEEIEAQRSHLFGSFHLMA